MGEEASLVTDRLCSWLCAPIFIVFCGLEACREHISECLCHWVGIMCFHHVACLWQCLSELWLQKGRSPGGTVGGLTGQWFLNKGAIQIGIQTLQGEQTV